MNNIILVLVISFLVLLAILTTVVVYCCLYSTVEADSKLRVLFEEYVKGREV